MNELEHLEEVQLSLWHTAQTNEPAQPGIQTLADYIFKTAVTPWLAKISNLRALTIRVLGKFNC
ncbi:hypothetical protein HGRIS_010891 [Hohenbuehelia grisea]|uniref:Uncharacterized protein n=1 Tax=Hohenbuehelia grisea TaxID=104357 RepID=A0ABR3IYF6_9AGAR